MKRFFGSMLAVMVLSYGLLEVGYRFGLALAPYEAEAQVVSSLTGGTGGTAYDFETLTVTTGTAVPFTAAKISPAKLPSAKAVQITVEVASIRYRYDGAAPTTTVGHLVPIAGDRFILSINNINQFKMIGGSGTATVYVTYLR